MKWLDSRDIRVIHANLITEHGGLASPARRGALDDALRAPKAALATSPGLTAAEAAAIHAWTFSRSQVFADGNLRLALAAALLFLAINGFRLAADPCEVVLLVRDAQRGAITFIEFSAWFDKHARALSPSRP